MSTACAAARLAVVLFWLATSAYAFLASVPFVHEQFLEPGLVPALVVFARWHGWLTLAVAAGAALALWPDVVSRRAPLAAGVLVWAGFLAGVAAVIGAPLTRLTPGGAALALSLAALVPVLWMAAIDLTLAPWLDAPRATDMSGRDTVVAAGSAVAVLAVQAVGALATPGAVTGLGLAQSAAAHLLLFAAVWAGLAIVRAVAELTSKPAQWEAVAAAGLLALLTGGATCLVLAPALAVTSRTGRGMLVLFGATIAIALAARGVRHGRAREGDGVVLVLGGLLPRWALGRTTWARLGWVALVLAGLVVARQAAAVMDWNFAVAKLGAVAFWLLALGTLAQWAPPHVRIHPTAPHAAMVVVVAGYLAAAGRLPGGPITLEAATGAADAWVVGDPSFRTLRDWLHRPVVETADAVSDGVGFFDYLQAHTNIARSIAVAPVPLSLADLDASPAAGRPPHVFVVVVDSLRRDYLSPYDPRIDFTPAIAAFAAESTVYRRAFTRYGATGLSVPSIWVGGMLLHKQYVTPFAPMNTLHALLGHHRYRRWMSMDNIVDVVMPRDDSLEPLDRRRPVADFRACSTFDELVGRLDRLTAAGPPAFVWTLPQDLHVAVLAREGKQSIDGGDYAGFYAPYASRVRRLDGCFGGFVAALKARGLYDDSVIVLTSDHGDSLGEEGRWGHAYTIYPEVLQVPLIVHLPPRLRERFDTAADAPAFTTDVTPTLHALLGHQVTAASPILGRPLVWPRGTAAPARPPFGLVASSYGSVYGWLDDGARELYIADGVGLRDYRYRLDGSPAGVAAPVTDTVRAAGQRAIRQGIQAIADLYRFTPPTP
ncbi:MAG: sulfatase-like hydrolase/transferase [Vicinamibacterales bacterium]